MTRKNLPVQIPVKPPEEWVAGEEPMTGPQDSNVHTIAREAGEEVPEEMTRAEASEKIKELQRKTRRGAGTSRAGKKVPGRKKSRWLPVYGHAVCVFNRTAFGTPKAPGAHPR